MINFMLNNIVYRLVLFPNLYKYNFSIDFWYLCIIKGDNFGHFDFNIYFKYNIIFFINLNNVL